MISDFNLFTEINNNKISGLSDELRVLYVIQKFNTDDKNIIVLCNSLYEATKFYNDLLTYTNDVYFFPMDDFLTSVAIAISPELKVKRLETLEKITQLSKKIIVTNLMGFLRFVPNKKTLSALHVDLKKATSINRESFEKTIDEFGYTRTSIVTSTGEYSIRGFIIDIYPFNLDSPIRIELFGSNIEDIKEFDPESQLSTKKLNNISILPYREINNSQNNSLYELLSNPLVVKIDPELINQANMNLEQEIFEYKKANNLAIDKRFMYSLDEIIIKNELLLSSFDSKEYLKVNSSNLDSFNSNYSLLKKFVLGNCANKKVIFCTKNYKFKDELYKLFSSINDNIKKLEHLNLFNIAINRGFIFNDYVFISENDIEKPINTHRYQNPVKIGRKIKDFNDIKVGDYIVHSVHGIGIYGGVITLEKNGIQKDYLLLNYAKNDKVYIPVEKIGTIYKYSDQDGVHPKVNELNSTTWAKKKASIRNRIKDISQELLKLYAERSKLKTQKYKFTPEDEVFASDFEYLETKDQVKCINDVLADLNKDLPMDRLICGDVGFGKTEVAFRAIFNTIINGYQVAYLCPTTILSKQQYDSALNRFRNFPINMALVNRFTTTKEYNNILNKLEKGELDLVFGTHRLLNSAIKYQKLGLLIIDEEQRFGVTHKEKIKKLKKNVNVLTLSATPIPRTLKMAMSGLKDLSILDTAPSNRYPVQTYVVEKNDILIKDAIYKEISRNGQIFYLFNNVNKIQEEANKLHRLVPDARICFAYGQMPKHDLENIIEDFVNFKFDVLVCTTIIETGIDIPNVNTLIIIDAQNYGLSQLYQLRGRVGRSNKIAYAYLTYNPAKTLTETAVKRLKSIKEFTELGSGYKIAMRDLSIRGAGDLLGSEQAGFIDSVGIELYTKMIEETMNEIKGIPNENDEDMDSSLINVNTHIDEKYVNEESVRIEIHKLINTICDYKSLQNVKMEIEDRFGKIDENMEIYMYEEWFEKLADKLQIKNVMQVDNRIEIQLPENISSTINGEKLFLEMYNINPKFKIKYQFKRITISLNLKDANKHYIFDLVNLFQKIVDDME
jgi:transcription-repair coupling factor (superfamily II helicase)